MYEKILAALKAKFNNKGLPEKVLVAIAKRLEATVTEENQIDAAVTAEETVMSEFQSFADSRFEAGKKITPTPAPGPKPEEAPAPTPQPTPDDAPAWAKGLIETNKQLADRLNAIEQGKSTETRKSKVEAALNGANAKFKDSTLKDFGRIKFDKDEDFDEYLNEVTERAKDFKEANDTQQRRPFQPQAGGGGAPNQAAANATAKNVVGKLMQ